MQKLAPRQCENTHCILSLYVMLARMCGHLAFGRFKIIDTHTDRLTDRLTDHLMYTNNWLPVNYRIKFKLSTLTYRALAIHQPPYLASLLHFSNVPRQLRSSTSHQLSIPRTKLNLGKHAFSVAAPIIWNELPTTLKVLPLSVNISKLISSKLRYHLK